MVGIAILLAALGVAGTARAQTASGTLQISGTSTVRAWTCQETHVRATLTAESGFANRVLAGERAVEEVRLTFPVADIRCGSGKMEEHLRHALKAKRFPNIKYAMSTYELGQAAAGALPVEVDGLLTIAGDTRPVQLKANVTRVANGAIRIRGEEALDMTRFGVEPPKLFFGTLRVGDRVNVTFDVVLRGQVATALTTPAAGGE